MYPGSKPRVALGQFLIRLGRIISASPVAVLKPDDLMELSRRRYHGAGALKVWGSDQSVDLGLYSDEQELLEKLPLKSGRLMVLGMGGGREALALSRLGFEVAGIENNSQLVAKALDNARKRGLNLQVLEQDITQLQLPSHSFDLATLFAGMYSAIPTRRRRLKLLMDIHRILKPGGYFLCTFVIKPEIRLRAALLKTLATFTLGNLEYEPGDMIWGSEFLHGFASLAELKSEFGEAGFSTLHFTGSDEQWTTGALLRTQA